MQSLVGLAVPVPVVRLIITDPTGRVLILQRADTDYGAGVWCLPGGKVDYGETVEEAVRKELLEETALECTESRFLFYQDSPPLGAGRVQGINFYFACQVRGEIHLNEESIDYRWIGRSELHDVELAFRNREGLERFWDEVWTTVEESPATHP